MQPISDLEYRPLSEGWTWLSGRDPESVLVIGFAGDSQAHSIEAAFERDIRTSDSKTARRELHIGTYAVDVSGSWKIVVVLEGQPEGPAAVARYRTDDTHLGMARDIMSDHWGTSLPFLTQIEMRVGDLVRPNSSTEIGRVKSVSRQAERYFVGVEIGPGLQYFHADELEILDGDPRSPDFWMQRPPGSAEEIARTLSWIKLANPLTDMLYSFAATKTTFKPYQFIPALKILSSSTGRLLIADEVGLGKTIEAGLIWTELEQRSPIKSALVVVPAALRIKWKQEMERRFMRPLDIIGIPELRDLATKLREDQEPNLLGIISIEALRGSGDLLAELANLKPHFDLVIVDEAHVLRNKSSKSYQVGNLLSDWADYLVFLSATPLNLGASDFFNLVNLLDEGGFPDSAVFEGQLEPNRALNAIARNVSSHTIRSRADARLELDRIPSMEHGAAISRRPDFARLAAMLEGNAMLPHAEVAAVKRIVAELNTLGGVLTRTRKVDVPNKKAVREAEQIEVRWTEQERAFYDAVHEHYRQRALLQGIPSGFAMQMPLRQASSCIAVAQQRLWAKEGWFDDDDDVVYEFGDSAAGDEGAQWNGDESTVLMTRIRHDSKFDALVTRLRSAREGGMTRILIFSFFKGTVEYLAERLSPEFRTAVLHGGVPMNRRQDVIDGFRHEDFEILVSNQVGSEGLDFEFCNVLVNYDLPWNPMQVEQRIGRLDRFGQEHEKIFILNMHVPGTIEGEIIARLYARIGVFERSIGDLEPILRSAMRRINDEVLDPHLSSEQMASEADRLAVAIERAAVDAKQIEESSGILSTVSQLDIEGLSENGPSGGKYVGDSELHRLLDWLLARRGGSMVRGSREGCFILRGSPGLSRALGEIPRSDRGTMLGFGRLVGRLRDAIPIEITFRPEAVQGEQIELVTSRHPLIRLSLKEFENEPLSVVRYGSIGLPSIRDGSHYLINLSLARTVAVRSLCEMWITAVDMSTGSRDESVEDELMTALAEGRFTDPNGAVPGSVSESIRQLEGIVAQRQISTRTERSQDNAALADARIDSELNSLQIKIDHAVDQLRNHRAERAESSLTRMFEGRIRNLRRDREDVQEKYRLKRQLTLSVESVATIHATAQS